MTLTRSIPARMKRLLAAPLAAAVLLGGTAAMPALNGAAYAAELYQPAIQLKTLQIAINGQAVSVPGGIANNQTYVQLTFLSKQLGLQVGWDQKTKIISVAKKGKKLTIHQENGFYVYEVNGHKLALGSDQPIILKGSTYLPLRFLLEQMDYKIGYIAASKQVTIEPFVTNALTFTNKSYASTKNNVEVTIQYPQLEGFANAQVQATTNALIEAEAKAYQQAGETFQQDFGDGSSEAPAPLTYDVNYTVTKNDNGKLSFHFDVYEYSGGAHGNYDLQSHTYDLTTGKELTLKDAALGNADYISIINAEIKKQIIAQDLPLIEPFETIGADQRFYLRGDAIVVYFSLYEYTPYAFGIPEFTIPLSKFKA